MKKVFIILVGIISITFYVAVMAQTTDEVMNHCVKFITHPYISDGQQYRALLNEDEVAEFHATFYG